MTKYCCTAVKMQGTKDGKEWVCPKCGKRVDAAGKEIVRGKSK